MNYSPKVSVCVLTYNHHAYIAECLESIIHQDTDFAFEIVIADDHSTDGTAEIVAGYAQRYPDIVRPLLRDANLGPTHNFIDLHNQALGEYVAHIDGDDLMLPGKLQKQAQFLGAHPDYSVVWHRVNLFDDFGGFMPGETFDISFYPNGTVELEHALRLGSVAVHSSIMYRRSCRKTREANGELLDLFYTWEFLSSGKGKILCDVLGSYRVAAKTSIRMSGIENTQSLVAQHALYYLSRMPHQRRNIFSLSIINFLWDIKNRRASAKDFGMVALRSFSLVSPLFLLRNLREMQKLPRWSPKGVDEIATVRQDRTDR